MIPISGREEAVDEGLSRIENQQCPQRGFVPDDVREGAIETSLVGFTDREMDGLAVAELLQPCVGCTVVGGRNIRDTRSRGVGGLDQIVCDDGDCVRGIERWASWLGTLIWCRHCWLLFFVVVLWMFVDCRVRTMGCGDPRLPGVV